MAATVEGTFLLLDRASPQLRDIRRNALEADAAVAGLGRTLDGVGSRRQAKQLETYARQTRVAGNEERALGREVDRTTGGLRQHERQVGRVRGAWRGLLSQFRELRLLAIPLKFFAIGAAVGYLVQGVGALAGGLVALLPRISDLAGLGAPAVAGLFGLASGMIAAKLATSGLSKAMAGNKAALKALTPEGKTFLATLKEYKPVLKGLREQSQKGLFPSLTAAVARAASAAPTAGKILRRGGSAVGGAALTVVRGITKEGNLGDIAQLAAQGDQMIRSLARDFVNLLGVVLNFGVAARPFTRWVTTSVEAWTKHRLAISQFNRDSGKTAAMLERTKTSIKGFVALTKDLWGAFKALGRAARPVGDDLWRSTDKAVRAWRLAFESPEGMVRNRLFFAHIRDDVHAIFRLVGALSRALIGLTGQQSGFVGMTDSLTAAVPSIGKILGNLTKTFGPTLAATLKTLADVLGGASGWLGPWNILLTTINGVLKVVDRLVHGSSAFGGLLKDVFAVALISRFLVKLGLLEAGWWRIGRAATAAGAAEAAAMSGGMGAPGRGLGGVATGFGMSRRAVAAGEEGAFLSGGFGRSMQLGSWLGRGRTGALLGGASKLAPLAKGLSVPLIAASIGASFLPGKAGTVGQSAAAGAGIGALAGTIVPGLGNLAGAGLGAALGGAYGLLKGGPSKSSKRLAEIDKSLTLGLAALGYYPTELGRLQAQLKLYQATASRLAGENSAEAQQQLSVIQQEIDARRQAVTQLKTEMRQRKLNANVSLGRAYAAQLGGIWKAALKSGESRPQARADVEMSGLAMLKDIPAGPGRVGLARTLIEYVRSSLGGSKAEVAKLKAEVAAIEPKGVGVLDPVRRPKGTRAELGGLKGYLRKSGFTEGYKEATQDRPTAFQVRLTQWLIAAGMPPDWAAAYVMASDVKKVGRAAKMPNLSFLFRGATRPAGHPEGGPGAALAKQTPPPDSAGAKRMGPHGIAEHAHFLLKAYGDHGKTGGPGYVITWTDGTRSWLSRTKAAAFGVTSSFAHGGRVAGASLHDDYQIGPNAWAGGGELVVNRHTERKVDGMLGGRATLGGLVGGETRPHSAPLEEDFMRGGREYARGGRLTFATGGQGASGSSTWHGLQSPHQAIRDIGDVVLGKFPGLTVTATLNGRHAKNSYHYKGEAIDLASSTSAAGLKYMNAAGAWIQAHLAGSLLEGIHNNTLSVKNGQPASMMFWGPETWAGHVNHIHLAADRYGKAAAKGVAKAATASPAAAAKPSAAPVSRYEAWERQVAAIQGFPSGWGMVSGGVAPPAATVATAPGAGGPAPKGAKAIARGLFGPYGWGDPQFPPLEKLWTKESGWNVRADTRKSGLDPPGAKVYAYGIPQARPAEKMASSGADWRTNPKTQIAWGLGYIASRYGTPANAWAHEVSDNWYAKGGRTPEWAGWHARGGSFTTDGPTVFGAGERGKEHVSITPVGHRRTPFAPHVEVNVNGGDPAAVQAAVERALHSVASQLDLVGVDGEDGF